MNIQEIAEQVENSTISADAQVWVNLETGDMQVASDAEMSQNWDYSYAGTAAEMVAAQ